MKKTWLYINLITGLLSAWLFIDHISGFIPHDYFFIQNPDTTLYSGINVVSRWADFSFFTYHTMIFYSIWSVGLFITHALKLARANNFFTHTATVTFIQTNYILTTVLYTVFELASGNPTFGLYDFSNKAIHSLGTNLLAHYVFSAIAIISGFKLKCGGKLTTTPFICIAIYLIIYYIAVKLTGMHCYKIEWYPYPFLHPTLLCNMLGIKTPTPALSTTISIITTLILAACYFGLYYGVYKLRSLIENRKAK